MTTSRLLKLIFGILVVLSVIPMSGCANAEASADPQERTSEAAPGEIRTSHERATARE